MNLAEAGQPHRGLRRRSTAAPTTCFHYTLPKLGIDVTFIDDPDDLDAWRAAVRPNTKAFYGETIGNPRNDVLDIEGVVGGRPRDRRAADRRQHRRLAVPHPPARVGRRHRRALRHQVHRRPRHLHRRRHRRRRHLRLLGERQVPDVHRARPELPRPAVLAGPRHGLVHHQGPRAAAARHGRRHHPVQLVPVPPGPRDAEPAHGAPQRQRPGRGRVPRRPRPGRVGAVRRPARARAGTSGPPATPAARATARCRRSSSRAARRRARSSSRPSSCTATWPTSATCAASPSTRPAPPTAAHRDRAGLPPASSPGLVRLSVGLETIDDIIADLDKGFAAAQS